MYSILVSPQNSEVCSLVLGFVFLRLYKQALRFHLYFFSGSGSCERFPHLVNLRYSITGASALKSAVIDTSLISGVPVRMRVSAHCADAFLNVSFSGFYRTGVRRLRPVRRQRTLQLCGIRIKSFGTLFVSAPLCGDSDLCDPDRNQSAVVGCFERTPLYEDCDLCDQKQITANIAALRVLYHVWYGNAAAEGMTLCFAAGHGR